MTSHIAQCAGAKLPPAAPVERHEVIDIVGFYGSPEPQIPIEFLGNRWFAVGPGNSLRPYRAVGPAIHFFYITNQPGFKPFPHRAHAVTGRTLITHLCHYLVF